MTLAQVCLLLLVLAIVLATLRYFIAVKKNTLAAKPKLWRVLCLLTLQIASALLLYFCLFPPPVLTRSERLVILTANADTKSIPASERLLALPEATARKDVEPVPDLATALRRYPGVTDLHIIGTGLGPRDIDAAKDKSISFSPSTLPAGITEVWYSEHTTPGSRWEIRGRIHSIPEGQIELLSPGNSVVASSNIDTSGGFIFSDTIRSAGLLLYRLRLVDPDKNIIDVLDIPLHSTQSPALRVLSLSGGPNAETKYLHRWAMDAGIKLDSQISLGAGMQLASSAIQIHAATLNDIDVLVIDERAWSAMNSGSKQAVINALRNGLGVLLRITGPLTANHRSELRRLGFNVNDVDIVQGVRLHKTGDGKTALALSKRPLQVNSRDAVNLFQDENNQTLALWRAEGRGRIGLWWLSDSYRLVLNDQASTHGQLWQKAFATLARARNAVKPSRQALHSRVHERSVFCDLAEKSYVKTPSGTIDYLIAENHCGSFWPNSAGWHALVSGDTETPFYVRRQDEALALKAAAMQEATRTLTTNNIPTKNSNTIAASGSHWPWFLAWLLISALLWALERSRIGLRQS